MTFFEEGLLRPGARMGDLLVSIWGEPVHNSDESATGGRTAHPPHKPSLAGRRLFVYAFIRYY